MFVCLFFLLQTRVEFNEPMADSVISNNYRMRMTIPTIKYALKWRARAVIILAHFGEPRGKRDNDLTLKPICDEMATLLGETVRLGENNQLTLGGKKLNLVILETFIIMQALLKACLRISVK